MILGRLIPRVVRLGVREAMREHLLEQVDRVLRGIFEPGVESYTFRGLDAEPVTLTGDQLLVVVGALRDRFKAEL